MHKLLQGRTYSYSDTQRYRVGANYLQLPINRPKGKQVATNQNGGQMDVREDYGEEENPHINYEPSLIEGLKEAKNPGVEHEPYVSGDVKREPINRQNNFGQAGETYRRLNDWEREELISNLVGALKDCHEEIQKQMIENFKKCDEDYGKRVEDGLQMAQKDNIEKEMTQSDDVGHASDPY